MQNGAMKEAIRTDMPISTMAVQGVPYQHVNLSALLGPTLTRLPHVLRVLLENVVRTTQGAEQQAHVEHLLQWLDHATSEAEIPFQPGRVLMHDTTSTPALVDIAGMRDALAEAGVDPAVLSPTLPVDVSVDHSLAVEVYGRPDAITLNMQHEIRRNRERYRFLRWASKALDGVSINPPGTGIMHTINMEQLATVSRVEERHGQAWLIPDVMLGTDSHTPMVNGLGVLGWGVGGLEAQTVMFGMPTMLRIPDVVGVRLMGRLTAPAQATDLALTVTQRLRALDVTGEFVEFFGPGVSTLSANERAVVANMAPEYGATTGYFPVDEATLSYLAATGRSLAHIDLVRAHQQASGLWFDPHATPVYSKTIDIDLGQIGVHIAGPTRPQDLLSLQDAGRALDAIGFQPKAKSEVMPLHPVGIAAISSCTNTSDPRLLIAAGLLARKARAKGLTVPHWVKTSLAPGSPAAASYLQRAGLTDDLAALGFNIVGYGCSTCIGNPGPLTEPIRLAQERGEVKALAIVSGNRNFPGRVHPDIELSYIMSPLLVVAFAIAGDARRNLRDEPLQTGADGNPVHLADIWPSASAIDETLRLSQAPADYAADFARASANPLWHGIEAPDAARFPWDEASTALRRPPFASLQEGSQLGSYRAYPLLVLGDDITTDHISPASAIPPDSLVADFLVERGDDRRDLNVFASRRGNWEVMLRAAFHNKNLRNLLAPGAPVAHTLHIPTGETLPLWEVSARYKAAGQSVVIVAGERYGMGSSRDWAAKGQRLLGVRAVLAVGFERIHRSNLIGMGILPVRMTHGVSPTGLNIQPGDEIEVVADAATLSPRCDIEVRLRRRDGSSTSIPAKAAVETQLEVELLQKGGVIPAILEKTIAQHRQ
jgi:aconitate hydratase